MPSEKTGAKKNSRLKRFIDALHSLVSLRFPWLAAILGHLPLRHKGWLNGAIGLVVIGLGLWEFGGDLRHIAEEWYGPDVIVSALPPRGDLGAYGRTDLLYEFNFNKAEMATPLRDGDAVRSLATDRKKVIPVTPFICKGEEQSSPSGLHKLSVIVQNQGDRTANEYKLTITFSGMNEKQPDPGVRIAHVEADALTVDYIYQQEPDITIPACVEKAQEEEKKPEKPSALARSTYEVLGLSRDVVIVKGTLEPHLFQTVNLLIKAPPVTKDFVVLYHVECANCRLFYRTSSYGQVVRIQL